MSIKSTAPEHASVNEQKNGYTYLMYGNGTADNHGCEAIIRGTEKVLGKDAVILSRDKEIDARYGIDLPLLPEIIGKPSKGTFLLAYLKLKLTGNYFDMDAVRYFPAIRDLRGKARVALSVGGDNYCYDGEEFYGRLHRAYRRAGFKTVLWGCSVEPEKIAKRSLQKDLARYDAIVTRESITYDAIRKVNSNTYLAPDPAFFMEPEKCDLPEIFCHGPVIGVNASPMILSYAENEGKAYENFRMLIRHILDHTEYGVALIPHVVWKASDDRTVLQKLFEEFGSDDRVAMVEDHNAPKLKYIISNCEMFVGARTHATIAAYSTGVPTLVVGYSVKARGIAKDLFGTEENYVLPVQSLTDEEQLTEAFDWLEQNKQHIRRHLMEFLPSYRKKTDQVKEMILELEAR